MLIEKVSVIEFDEVKERQRILEAFKSKKYDALRPKLLKILDAVEAGEWKQMLILCMELSRDEREYLAIPVSDIAHELNDRVIRMGEAERNAEMPAKTLELLRMAGLPTGAISAAYPKFRVVPPDEAKSEVQSTSAAPA